MKKNELVSIIIPCYNQAQYLEESVQSGVHQTYPNIEIVIINDGSSDNTQEIAEELQKRYPEKISIVNQENMGLSEARNTGIKNASGQYIVSLDADDKLYETMVEKCINAINKHNADIVYTGYQGFGISDRINMWTPFEQTNPLYITPCGALAFIKKRVWEITGGYKYNMNGGYEDWEFWINAYKHNMKFLHIPEKLYFYRIKEESMITNALKKDIYLKAKIVMNHPELYISSSLQEAMLTIKKTEELADLYFYYFEDLPLDKVSLATNISSYMTANKLVDRQYITISSINKRVELCNLDLLKDKKSIKKLYKQQDADMLLFYSPMRYIVPFLKSMDFAWNKDNGIINAIGNIFPFVPKSEREGYESQLIAYERLVCYLHKKNHIQETEIERQVKIRENKDKLIVEKDTGNKNKIKIIAEKNKIISEKDTGNKNKIKIIAEKNKIIAEKNKIISEKNKIISEKNKENKDKIKTIEDINIKKKAIMQAIQTVIYFPLAKNPILKYKAYKSMLQTYDDLKKSM